MRRRLLVVVALLALVGACSRSAASPEVIVGAAASLRGVMPDLMASYAQGHSGVRLTVSYGASGDLRQQVQAGAPIDVVVLANGKPVDDLVRSRLASAASRRLVATNALVLVGPKGGKRYAFATLDTVPPQEKIAIGNPKTVPAGEYAEASLEQLGKWSAIQAHLVYASDVSGVLAYVRRGEVAAGIVYKTEIHGITDVDLFDELPPNVGPRPEVVAAVTTASSVPRDAQGFVDFLGSAEARGKLKDYGFGEP